jgi:hypothetical protein
VHLKDPVRLLERLGRLELLLNNGLPIGTLKERIDYGTTGAFEGVLFVPMRALQCQLNLSDLAKRLRAFKRNVFPWHEDDREGVFYTLAACLRGASAAIVIAGASRDARVGASTIAGWRRRRRSRRRLICQSERLAG